MNQAASAIVLLSGGLDSATVLAIASGEVAHCYALSINYGQRHAAELNAARAIAKRFEVREHRIVNVDIGQIGGSALTDDDIEVPTTPAPGIPVTYVPARNTLFLSLALGWAEVLGAQAIYIGVNALDYSGYPDCRPEFIAEFEQLAALATKAGVEGGKLQIRAPLIDLSKQAIVEKGSALDVPFSETVSCYRATDEGRACGACDACRLRRNGFMAAGIEDPTRYG
ncbi:MAG: 7-cyano-7-deazaguanine synthase QueC [Pseudomonadota bacterium]